MDSLRYARCFLVLIPRVQMCFVVLLCRVRVAHLHQVSTLLLTRVFNCLTTQRPNFACPNLARFDYQRELAKAERYSAAEKVSHVRWLRVAQFGVT